MCRIYAVAGNDLGSVSIRKADVQYAEKVEFKKPVVSLPRKFTIDLSRPVAQSRSLRERGCGYEHDLARYGCRHAPAEIFPEVAALADSGVDGAVLRRDFRSLLGKKLNSFGRFDVLCP